MYSTAILKQWIYYRFQEKSRAIQLIFQPPPTLPYKTNESLHSVKITNDDILKIIAKLDPNKAHGHYKINIHIIKIWSTSICTILMLIFNHCIDSGLCIYPCE